MKKMLTDFFSELYKRNRVLTVAGFVMLVLFVLAALIAPFDTRAIMGINPWIKPMKFLVSIAIYLWTLAWFSAYVSRFRKTLNVITFGAAITMTVEIICIVLQAARGTTSHFNISTPFNERVFSTMGMMIVINSLMVALMFVLFIMPSVKLPTAYLWGIRLGLLFLLIASAEGGIIVSNNAHTVGMADGGAGLPFVNWSREAGDLRIAHFMAMHGLQVFPLVGYLLSEKKTLSQSVKIVGLFAFTFLYAVVFAFVLWQALSGKSLLSFPI